MAKNDPGRRPRLSPTEIETLAKEASTVWSEAYLLRRVCFTAEALEPGLRLCCIVQMEGIIERAERMASRLAEVATGL